MFSIEWGTVGQWVGSFLTGGSLLLGYRILQINQADRRREQSSSVTFTVTTARDPVDDSIAVIRGSVFNHSELPIMYANVVIDVRELGAKLPTFAVVPVPTEDEAPVLRPGSTSKYRFEIPDRSMRPEEVEIRLEFVDASGRQWSRDTAGRLQAVEPNLRSRLWSGFRQLVGRAE
ncbi:Uncharacterised protein (plasmid) [Tsukamurella tyrosinosolvens]|uniref:Uncharacterized protein n=1 Tax=Tsukamurella tyrosinosolvens TaxID=57704 RepID=A0A1H4UK35_TSUTY|nr:hypothetical protein [Tsukamurella tyrosinosolvens]KXO99046.1 hypothetical protein AXK58_24130 [Tsukamurella tyrosinosolvens]SEC68970.1 hypothetical protein SAMN04489793_2928 [Tsukamurella tyrosinosolvens]VEH94278.1 Uncharacterised protein [Tsukamurella tyrosinosolvens]